MDLQSLTSPEVFLELPNLRLDLFAGKRARDESHPVGGAGDSFAGWSELFDRDAHGNSVHSRQSTVKINSQQWARALPVDCELSTVDLRIHGRRVSRGRSSFSRSSRRSRACTVRSTAASSIRPLAAATRCAA